MLLYYSMFYLSHIHSFSSIIKFVVDTLADFTMIESLIFLFLIDVALDKQLTHVLVCSSRRV